MYIYTSAQQQQQCHRSSSLYQARKSRHAMAGRVPSATLRSSLVCMSIIYDSLSDMNMTSWATFLVESSCTLCWCVYRSCTLQHTAKYCNTLQLGGEISLLRVRALFAGACIDHVLWKTLPNAATHCNCSVCDPTLFTGVCEDMYSATH